MNIKTPIKIRDFIIPSNVFFAPINPGYSSNGIFADEYMDFFVSHAGRSVGICYVGNVALHNNWSSNDNTAVLSQNKPDRWIALSKSINQQGSIPAIQLAWKPEELIMQRSFITNNLAKQVESFKKFYDSFNEFEETAAEFIKGINYSTNLGFPVVQLHAAHGYALSLLLSREISGCNDPKKTKGAKLIQKILSALNKRQFVLDIRLSLYEGINDKNNEFEYKMRLFNMLSDCGFDMISLSNGFYNINKEMIYPAKKEGPVILDEAMSIAKKFPNIIWNVAGNMECLFGGDTKIPENLTLSLGRQLLSDPDAVVKFRKKIPINQCSECNNCHYYSFGMRGIQQCKL